MEKKFNKSLFIFHRDLRLDDNTGLIKALKNSDSVIPCFIFDPVQVSDQNKFKSNNALQFMIESLDDLSQQLKKLGGKLFLFHGTTQEVIEKIVEHMSIDALFSNRDYTPFAHKRDQAIAKICKKKSIEFYSCPDALLQEPEAALKANNQPYTIFTPFFRNASKLEVARPVKNNHTHYFSGTIPGSDSSLLKKIMPKPNNNIFINGGRAACKKIITHLDDYKKYTQTRDFPALEATTKLSAHHKFGTYSIREIYYAIQEKLGPSHPLTRQLYWRDFFTHIAHHFPHVFGHAFHEKFDAIEWENNKKKFEAWCLGQTGFPIVDAGMRQLNTTGFMHNRVRMIVASFLVKDLHIDWRWGERYFATQLIDYDPAVNNGNWQWAASTGCDAQPYFRIFNPWLQQKKFDTDCIYIKQWIPELEKVSPKDIHGWMNAHTKYNGNYPRPIVDHSQTATEAKILFRNSAKN